MSDIDKNLTIPVGPLGIIALESSKGMAKMVNDYLVKWRKEREHVHSDNITFSEYSRDSFCLRLIVKVWYRRRLRSVIKDSVRGDDLYLLVDVTNHNVKYTVRGHENHMSPDDRYQDKRIIAVVGGKARRITVIMPFLYESRQHRRNTRESLDCALALQELTNMGVESIITFDAHDP